MIIWLASYPRSGNTLLRTVLKQTMGRNSYSQEVPPDEVGLDELTQQSFGHNDLGVPWESFYAMATASPEIHLVKTHFPPCDDQPVIYVYRDGRQSLVSYYRYYQSFYPSHAKSLLGLVFGDDVYGGWTDHYRAWQSESRKTLYLNYSDLVKGTEYLTSQLASFIGHNGDVIPWSNPFDELNARNSGFFRRGTADWKPDALWNPVVDAAFSQTHGQLMRELGFCTEEAVRVATSNLPEGLSELIDLAHHFRKQRQVYEDVCRDRLKVITILDAEVKRLQDA